MFLDFEWNGIEVLFLFQQDSSAVIVPEVAEVRLDSVSQFGVDVLVAAKGLVFYFFEIE